MRQVALRLLALVLGSALLAVPGRAQAPAEPPHAWLFGAWIGGLYPPPVTLSAAECFAQPVVIFTRDLVLRATFISDTYVQRRIDTVRATANGTEFRLVHPLASTPAGDAVFGDQAAPPPIGFGCEDADALHVVRHGSNEIAFPRCTDFPYPLVRCAPR